MLPACHIPTRVTDTTASLTDNLFTNLDLKTCDVIIYDDSDHFLILSEVTLDKPKVEHPERKTRKLDAESIESLRNQLNNINRSPCLDNQDVDQATNYFIQEFEKAFDRACPAKTSKSRRQEPRKPWISKGIVRSIKMKNQLYKIRIENPSEDNKEKFRLYKNNLTKVIRAAKTSHYTKLFAEASGSPKKSWEIIHGIIGKKKMSKFPEFINHGPELVSDRPGIANVFNKHFANVGVRTVKESVAANNSEQRNKFEDYLPPYSLSSLFLTPTSKEELINIVNLLKPDSTKKISDVLLELSGDGSSRDVIRWSNGCISPLELFNFAMNWISKKADQGSVRINISPDFNFTDLGFTVNVVLLDVQPQNRFRFRYGSEMKGTHGCLLGTVDAGSRNFPKVKLNGFDGHEAIIRVSLATNDDNPFPHPHSLAAEKGHGQCVDFIDVAVNAASGYIASFQGIAIIHCGKKQVRDVVLNRLVKMKLQAKRLGEFHNGNQLAEEEMAERGNPKAHENYRLIALVPALSKVLDRILDTRLSNWLNKNNLIHEKQGGFRIGYGTTDSVFVLETLIDKYGKGKTSLYVGFLDLHKAFDSVDRELLKDAMLNDIALMANKPQDLQMLLNLIEE
ncbi:hypothetical protein QYM36_007262 [Artemia franciscana]|uniref:RHD domain-containing protein n=1 Tax=Artemia franciscana TaxID=6661 RepID=A0AA88L4Z7_ARTSF|nr:hypothetical protein QYM36_007262 [Artemia franciscana]